MDEGRKEQGREGGEREGERDSSALFIDVALCYLLLKRRLCQVDILLRTNYSSHEFCYDEIASFAPRMSYTHYVCLAVKSCRSC